MKPKEFFFSSLEASNSPSGSLNLLDLQKTGRLLIVCMVGAALTAGLDFASNWLLGVDLGVYRPIIMPIISAGIEAGRRYIATNLTVDDLSK